ncbi:hypothetical protein [Saccharothrix sp. NRRL B-16348]|uniref:hypothetical protein n=1 Tax=Saccharothrix sp. NRRL B-16348 TaxID=1415542 RepID=UPI0012F91024|nr:hypothetical protein [Saccharothrix sp. NRRL B-16348]
MDRATKVFATCFERKSVIQKGVTPAEAVVLKAGADADDVRAIDYQAVEHVRLDEAPDRERPGGHTPCGEIGAL